MGARKPDIKKSTCPCGSARSFIDCCAPFLEGRAVPPSAEALMRSRYTAYALAIPAYVLNTWHPSTRPPTLDLAAEPLTKWVGLEVLRHAQADTSHATVEFVARYKLGGRAQRMRETSRFLREDERWFYLDGELA